MCLKGRHLGAVFAPEPYGPVKARPYLGLLLAWPFPLPVLVPSFPVCCSEFLSGNHGHPSLSAALPLGNLTQDTALKLLFPLPVMRFPQRSVFCSHLSLNFTCTAVLPEYPSARPLP